MLREDPARTRTMWQCYRVHRPSSPAITGQRPSSQSPGRRRPSQEQQDTALVTSSLRNGRCSVSSHPSCHPLHSHPIIAKRAAWMSQCPRPHVQSRRGAGPPSTTASKDHSRTRSDRDNDMLVKPSPALQPSGEDISIVTVAQSPPLLHHHHHHHHHHHNPAAYTTPLRHRSPAFRRATVKFGLSTPTDWRGFV